MLSVIIPASNEAAWIGACLSAVLSSDPVGTEAEVIVVANGCRDDTADVARRFAGAADAAGWRLVVLDLPEGGKMRALNAGDAAAARGSLRAYLDADVVVSPPLMAQVVAALGRHTAAYASGTPVIARAESWITRAYARFWSRLPFMQSAAPGFGLFAVNIAGRARWGTFPQIISDDTFVRLHFRPNERQGVPATYTWPMIEGFAALVKVRRRQDAGVAEIARDFPDLLANEGKVARGLPTALRLALRDPVGFAVYAAVSVAVRARRGGQDWVRGR